ncbi:calcium-binding protein [Streptococcus acidominimus]|uniref:Deoxyribonuclease n=1 Tax=Streptococcus acidominimus TaxID=1326 RepID=A0A380IGC5_STRAI|nr:calcium-binding protein [Streptococcus acidominimus]SUN07835.1 deoxyribonuclease [Streptococcus acidominimus]
MKNYPRGRSPLLKIVGLGFLILLLLPILVFLAPFGIWYYSKKKPDTLKRNISIGLSILAMFSIFYQPTNPNQHAHSAQGTPDSTLTTSSSTKTGEKEKTKKTEEKQKKAEEDKKAKEEQKKAEEAKKAEEERKKAEEAKKAEEERKKAEENKKAEEERKKAEQERLLAEGETAVQNLEANQVNENIPVAQSAVDTLPDSPQKTELQQRIQAVQSAIAQREETIRQEQANQAVADLAAQQEQRTVYVARNGTSDAYWYSLDNMPSNTRFDRVVAMSEAEAIASGKHPAKGHG